MQHEKATAEANHIIEVQKKLQVEYVLIKALYAAFNTERKLEEIRMIGNDSSSAGNSDAAAGF